MDKSTDIRILESMIKYFLKPEMFDENCKINFPTGHGSDTFVPGGTSFLDFKKWLALLPQDSLNWIGFDEDMDMVVNIQKGILKSTFNNSIGLDFMNSLRILKHVPVSSTSWDTMMKDNLIKQIDVFLNILPAFFKKHQDIPNLPISHFFTKEFNTACDVQNTVRNQLQGLKNYCESGTGYTNEIQIIKVNILKGIFNLIN